MIRVLQSPSHKSIDEYLFHLFGMFQFRVVSKSRPLGGDPRMTIFFLFSFLLIQF
jgi:hypothetical protein